MNPTRTKLPFAMLGADVDVDAVAGGGYVFIRRGHFGQLSGNGETGAVSIAFLKTPRIGQKRTDGRKTTGSSILPHLAVSATFW
jgi:hypothetical protein